VRLRPDWAIEIVQLILGHSSPTVTRRIYAHVMKKATAEQVETASRLIAKQRRDQSVTKPTAGLPPQSQPFNEQQVRVMITSGQGGIEPPTFRFPPVRVEGSGGVHIPRSTGL
jgi:hypothetical protein